MSDPWYADKIPLGTGLQHRHGKLEVDFAHHKNVAKSGPAGPKGDPGTPGPPGPPGADGAEGPIELPPYTVADAGKSLVVKADGTLTWRFISGGGGEGSGTYDDTITYDSSTTYDGG